MPKRRIREISSEEEEAILPTPLRSQKKKAKDNTASVSTPTSSAARPTIKLKLTYKMAKRKGKRRATEEDQEDDQTVPDGENFGVQADFWHGRLTAIEADI